MRTEHLDNKINELETLRSRGELTYMGVEMLSEFNEIKQALITHRVSNRLNEGTLEEINTIMCESYMIKSRNFDRDQGAMIMKELEKWAKR